MAYVVAEPFIGTKDAACVDACPVDWIHPKKNTTYDDRRPVFDDACSSTLIPWSASIVGLRTGLSGLFNFCAGRSFRKVEALRGT